MAGPNDPRSRRSVERRASDPGTLSAAGAGVSAVPGSTGPDVAAHSAVAHPHQLSPASAVPRPELVRLTSDHPLTDKARTVGLGGSGPSWASVRVSGPLSSLPVFAPRWP